MDLEAAQTCTRPKVKGNVFPQEDGVSLSSFICNPLVGGT
jgi:hypothetical protein